VHLKLYQVTATIQDQVATTHVEQTFVNQGPTPVEGTYLFPLPEQAAIGEFNMVVDGSTFEGQIMRKEEARAIYESIVRQQRDPALLEYIGRDLFQARIFPIPPGGERKIELTYSQVLPNEGGLVRYRYPLRAQPLVTSGAGVRFVQPIGQLAITVDIVTTRPLKAIYSPTYPVVTTRTGDFSATVGYEAANVLPSEDFDLYFSIDQSDVGVSLMSYKPATEDGYFLLIAAPKVEVDRQHIVGRDVFLVLDTSGSMEGQKMEQARNALVYVLDHLNAQDRFNVIGFSTGVRQFERGPQPTDRSGDAKQFVNSLAAGGSTDINRALLEALAQVDEARPTVLVFLTDGLPTVGEVDAQRIIANVRQETGKNVQLFAFGVGDDVNTVLLDTISQESRGASTYVRPFEAIDESVSGFYQKISTPVLSDLDVNFGEVRAEDLYPYPLPDLFAGSQLVAVGRYRDGGAATITLRGLVNGEAKEFVFDDQAFRTEGGEPFIARLWATRKIGYLLSEIRLRGYNQEMVDEIITLSTTYGIATPYTSFFVPEPQIVTQPRAVDQMGAVPLPTTAPAPAAVVELGRAIERAAERALAAAPAQAPAGEAAVADSRARETLRSATTAVGGAESGTRRALDKTFASQAGMWVDTTYTADLPQQAVAFGSEDYFGLLADHPEWAAYFAVSSNIIVVLDGTAYVVTDDGQPLAAIQEPNQPTQTVSSPQPPAEATTPVAGSDAAVQPATAQPTPSTSSTPRSQQSPLCTAPAFGLGLIVAPGAWAWRRRRRQT
jgi:Ca-activated chloride channel family protein